MKFQGGTRQPEKPGVSRVRSGAERKGAPPLSPAGPVYVDTSILMQIDD